MKRALVILLLAAGMVLVSPSVALACSCAQTSVTQQAKDADTVVSGTLEWVADNSIDRTYSVQVDQVFKGIAGLREKVHSPVDEASCGLGELATDKQYVFFMSGKHPGRLTATLCGGTAPYGEKVVTEVEKETGDPVEPLPTYVTDVKPTEGPDKVRIAGIAAFVIAGIAGGAIVLRRRWGWGR